VSGGDAPNGDGGYVPVHAADVTDDALLARRFEQHVEHIRTEIDLVRAGQDRLEAKLSDFEGVVLRVERIMTKILDGQVARQKADDRARDERRASARARKRKAH
jgi:hypothetical protein